MRHKFRYLKWHWAISIITMIVAMYFFCAWTGDDDEAFLVTILFSFLAGAFWAISFLFIHVMLYLSGERPIIYSYLAPTLIHSLLSLLFAGITFDLGWVLTIVSALVNILFWSLNYNWKIRRT